jgi:hypothetical protein
MSGVVHIVHCIDTEGPLTETLRATFERLHAAYGLSLEPTLDNLKKLQTKSLPLGGVESEVAATVAPQLLNYNTTWADVDQMLHEIMSPQYRLAMRDSFGGGWIYNWHCVDHVGFVDNPRRRELGFHNIFDHYREICEASGSPQDGIHFHHHPVPPSRRAHLNGNHYFNHTPVVFEILARRIIDRQWFPCAYRPGFHIERPDSHWFLEQFIPFDFGNQAMADAAAAPKDQTGGRGGDWRRAPAHWQPYHPAHDDYQRQGECRRWIARCLNVGTRYRLLTTRDVEQAFSEAAEGKPVVLAFTNHDHRDMRPDIAAVREIIAAVAARWPAVKFKFCEAREAMRRALELPAGTPPEFDVTFADGHLHVRAKRPIFGPQPFLAYKTADGRYFHDNFDFEEPFREWRYSFDEQTVPVRALSTIGLGACDAAGNASAVTIDVATSQASAKSY